MGLQFISIVTRDMFNAWHKTPKFSQMAMVLYKAYRLSKIKVNYVIALSNINSSINNIIRTKFRSRYVFKDWFQLSRLSTIVQVLKSMNHANIKVYVLGWDQRTIMLQIFIYFSITPSNRDIFSPNLGTDVQKIIRSIEK